MKSFTTILLATAALIATTVADTFPWERLNKNDSVLLIVDIRTGLYGLARDFDPTSYYNAMLAHSAMGHLFDLPVIITSSAQTGPNGPFPKEILDMYVSKAVAWLMGTGC